MTTDRKHLILCAAACLSSRAPQAPGRAARRSPSWPRATAENVVVDVIVRDKKGRTVTTLKDADFEVSDNGQAGKIESFRLAKLIFDRLEMNARHLAGNSALD